MALTNSLRRGVHLKRWEACAPPPGGIGALASISTIDSLVLVLDATSTTQLFYDPYEDSWMFGAGYTNGNGLGPSNTVTFHPSGPTGTASAGAATTITTTTTLPGSLAGYVMRITGGTGIGQERTIASNTFGANSVITVTAAWATNPDSTSVYLLLTGRFWCWKGASTAALDYFDVATNAWVTGRSVSGVTASSSEWRLVATPAYGQTIASGTATSATSTTLSNSGKAWATSQWINYQVRITAGTGLGQIRTITANTGTALTVATWTTTPDSTSTYVIEPNDDFLYLSGGGATPFYRYSISGNSWSTMTARPAVTSAGHSLNWIPTASDSTWADETAIKNGRYLYSFSGAGNLYYYDIAANAWTTVGTAYQRYTSAGFSFVQGWSVCADREFLYIVDVMSTTPGLGRCYRFNCVKNTLDPLAAAPFVVSNTSANGSHKGFIWTFTEGGQTLRYLYLLPYNISSPVFFRMLLI